MNEIPVSDAPTITILVLLLIFKVFKSFLVIIERENGASSWSKTFLSESIPFLLFINLYKSSVW